MTYDQAPFVPLTIPLPSGLAYGFPCRYCLRAACYLRPRFLQGYYGGSISLGLDVVYHSDLAGFQPRHGDPIFCQWCHATQPVWSHEQVGLYLQENSLRFDPQRN